MVCLLFGLSIELRERQPGFSEVYGGGTVSRRTYVSRV